MSADRGDLEVESLLRLILVLVVVWIGLEVVGEAVETTVAVLEFASPVLGVVIVALILLWLTDRI